MIGFGQRWAALGVMWELICTCVAAPNKKTSLSSSRLIITLTELSVVMSNKLNIGYNIQMTMCSFLNWIKESKIMELQVRIEVRIDSTFKRLVETKNPKWWRHFSVDGEMR